MSKVLKSSTGKKVTNQKPVPEKVEILEMDFVLLLSYMESIIKGSRQRMLDYYEKQGMLVNYSAAYLDYPDEQDMPLEYAFLKQEYSNFRDICFDIIF